MNLLLQNRVWALYPPLTKKLDCNGPKGKAGGTGLSEGGFFPRSLAGTEINPFLQMLLLRHRCFCLIFFLIAIINHFIPASVFDNDWLPFCRLHFSKLFTPLPGLDSEVSCILFFLWFQPPANHSVWWLFITQPWASVFVFLPALAWPSSSSFSPSWSRMCVPGGPLTHSMPHPLLPPTDREALLVKTDLQGVALGKLGEEHVEAPSVSFSPLHRNLPWSQCDV